MAKHLRFTSACIEWHPENGRAPWVLSAKTAHDAKVIWFAYETVARAGEKLAALCEEHEIAQ